MVFKQWYDLIGHDIVVLPKDNERSIKLTKKDINDSKSEYVANPLSPVTTFILNSWSHILNNDKNLIVNFPTNYLNILPLLGYLSSKLTSKSTLIFSSGKINFNRDLIARYNRNYHLLSWEGSDYLFRDIPICRINKNTLEATIYMPRASKAYKHSYLQSLKEDLISSDTPKILLNDSLNLTKVYNTVESIFIGDEEINSDFDLDIGCIIFENADRYLSSEAKAKNFVEWLGDTVGNDVKFLVHFSNSNLKFIPYFKESINALLIPFTGNILRNNVALYEPSMEYFRSKSFTELKVLNAYNCDHEDIYEFNFDISVVEPLLEKGNLDSFLYYSNNLLNSIDGETVKNKSYFYRIINLLYSINNLTINPDSLTFKTNLGYSWKYLSIPQFLNLFYKRLIYENSENRYLLNKLLSNLYGFYLELSQCKRYGVEGSYERIAKDHKLLEIIHNKNKYFGNDKKLIVATYFNTEVNVLKSFLEEDCEDIEVIYVPNMFKSYRDFHEYNLLLSGIVPPNYFSILRMPFNKVLILAYEGYNNVILNYQIESILNPSIEDEKIEMDYFNEFYKFLGENTNNLFFNDFKMRYEESHAGSVVTDESNYSEDLDEGSNGISIKEIFNLKNNYAKYVEGQKRVDSHLSDSNIGEQSYIKPFSSSPSNEIVIVDLINLADGLEYSKELLKNKKYLRFKSYEKLDEALEVKPDLLNKDDYVVVLESDKSFLDIYLDLFDEDEYIDRDFVDYWKELLSKYIEEHDLSLKAFYKLYEKYCNDNSEDYKGYQTVRNWARGYTIAPKDPTDLKKLAIIMGDEYLLENYISMHIEARKLRSLNMRMGRKLSSLIKEIILNSGDIDFARLSFEERIIYNKIKDSIYQVL